MHTHYKLANEMQQHDCHTPPLYGVWCNHGNLCAGGSCRWFIDTTVLCEGQSGQEKTDLEVRKAHYQIDVASVIQLESLLCLSVCIGASEELSNWL